MQATATNLNKARDAQHEYLRGLVLDDKRNINTITCPCGEKIRWGHVLGIMYDGQTGKCLNKCGHEFIYVETDDDQDETETARTIYCRRKMNGDYPFHIGELVGWRIDAKQTPAQAKARKLLWGTPTAKSRHVNIPMDSPFYAWAEYTGHDAVFLVIGVELSGDRVLVATNASDTGLDWNTLNPIEAKEITETTRFDYIGCFWVPIEYLESVSEWPYID